MSWLEARLGDVLSDIRSGFASGEDVPDGVIQIRMNNVTTDGTFDWSRLRRVPIPAKLDELSVVPGDILFNATNSPELVGKNAVFDGYLEAVTFSNHFFRLRIDSRFADSKFVSRWLVRCWAKGVFSRMCRQWVNQASINKEQLLDLKIPLPPLDEQRRIAAILDQADALRRARRRALDRLNDLGQSIFYEMFGDLVLNNRNWPQRQVSEFVSGFQSGKNLVADDQNEVNTRFRVLKVSAVTSLEFLADESKPLPLEYHPPEQHFVKAGDLLFSRANTEELIGATALVLNAEKGFVLPDKIWKFLWYQDDRADPYFVWYLFRQERFRNEIRKRATGTSGSMKNIPQEKVLGLTIGLPNKSLQSKFGSLSQGIEQLKQKVKRHLFESDVLFSSLQRQAFTGDLK